MNFSLKYGADTKRFTLPDQADVTLFEPRTVPVLPDVAQALAAALDTPVDCPPLEARPAPAGVAIAVPDETRPTPLKLLLPPLLDRLFAAYPGLQPEQVTIVVGGGLHPAPDAAQLSRILPGDLRGCRVVAHDATASPLTGFGRTSRGTPVEVNAEFARAGLKIVVGQIDPHQFVGFTGGAKGVVIGLGSKAFIQHNHSLMADPKAKVGAVETNPVRLDQDEAGEMIGVDMAVNVVLNPAKQVVGLVAGKPAAAMRRGAEITARVYGLSFRKPFDIAVASCGGYPKDICLYQAQKGLNMASLCVREGGRILLLAQCPQGIGDEAYHDYVRRFSSAAEQLEEFAAKGFRIGAHKAYLMSRSITRFEVVVVSDLDAATLASCHLTKGELEPTLARWTAGDGARARIAVIPSANTTYFYEDGGH